MTLTFNAFQGLGKIVRKRQHLIFFEVMLRQDINTWNLDEN